MILCSGLQVWSVAAFADSSQPAAGHPFAAPQVIAPPPTSGVNGLGQVTLALLIVLAAVFAVAWVLKRMRGFNSRVGDAIDVIADVPLGQKERAVLLKVGKAQILVGVAPGQVNTLHVLAEPIDLAKPATAPADGRPDFKSILLRSLGK
jgi:flagellar protein FliO/FliZ